MAEEGAELKEFLDKLGEEEKPSSTATVWNDLTYAIDDWLQKISVLEERQCKLNNLQERIHRTLQQLQLDGLISIYDFSMLNYVGCVWIDLINLVSSETMEKDIRKLIINNLLKLYDAGQISVELFTNIIVNL